MTPFALNVTSMVERHVFCGRVRLKELSEKVFVEAIEARGGSDYGLAN